MQRHSQPLLALLALAALGLLAAGLHRAAPRPVDLTGTPSFLPLVQNGTGIEASFRMHQTAGAVNQNMFFDFSVTNVTSSTITYGILAAHTDQGVTADSWHDPLLPGKTIKWTDHINFPNAGTYQVYLGICYSSHDACQTGGAPWMRLSDSVMVVIYPTGVTGTPVFLPLVANNEISAPTATPTLRASPTLCTACDDNSRAATAAVVSAEGQLKSSRSASP